MIQTSWLS